MIDQVAKIIKETDFDKEFIIDDIMGKSYTYNCFFSLALCIANHIDDNVQGENVIAVKENSLELALLYFAVMLTHKKIYVIDPQKGKNEIEQILDGIEESYLFSDNNLEYAGKHAIIEIPNLEVSQNDNNRIKDAIIERMQTRSNEMPYLVTFTSGTSGITKGVEHTLDNIFLSAMALDKRVRKTGGTFLHVMPMTYMAGVLNSLFYPFLVGARIVITERFSVVSSRYFWDTVVKYDANLFWLSPSMLLMIDRMDRKNIGEEYCQDKELVFLIGTAPLTNELRQRFNKRYGVNVYASYGLSETLFISVENDESFQKSESNSVGQLLPGVECKFSDQGEIYLKVPWMFCRYTNENINSYFEENYYKSGDLAVIKNDCLYITGRSKDLIIKGGMNISPILIENIVYQEEQVLENVVIGVKDRNGEEKICCVYTLKQELLDNLEFEANIKKQVLCSLGKNYALDYLWRVKDIPRNINGKIDKNKLIKMWESCDV